jgi:hypothetical protein
MTSKVKDQSDIENNNSFTELKSILVKPDEKKNARIAEFAVRVVCFLLLFIFVFPMIFCDYYFAMNNESCVKQPLHVSLTIYDYLIVNAIFGSIVVVGILFLFMYCDSETTDKLKDNCLFIILMHLVRLFGISWIVVGAVMYWGEMNRTLCSQQTNDYLTASLILRIIMTSFEVNHSYNKRQN